jgi:hypothetical protein
VKIIYKDYVSTTTESSKNTIPKIENKKPYPITVKTVEHPNFLIDHNGEIVHNPLNRIVRMTALSMDIKVVRNKN